MTRENEKILKCAIKALEDKKALDVSLIEISDLTIVTDYFLLATGTSSTHVRSLADEVDHALSQIGIEPHHIEGRATGWVLLDYNGVVVHVFSKESREFYSLDKLWNDGRQVELSSLLPETAEEQK